MAAVSFRLRTVGTGQLDGGFPFCLRYDVRDPALEKSVADRGVIEPVWVFKGKKWTVISGHRRAAAARAAGIRSLPALELKRRLSRKELFGLAVLSNWQREWTDLDRCCALRKAVDSFRYDSAEVAGRLFPVMGLECSAKVFEIYDRASRLDPGILRAVAEGRLSFRGIASFFRFSPTLQSDLSRLVLGRVRLTAGESLKTGEWLYDLCKSGAGGIGEFLRRTGLDRVLTAAGMDEPSRSRVFFDGLRAARFPRVAAYEKRFRSTADKLPGNRREYTVEPPPAFEDEGFVLKAPVRNSGALEKLTEALSRDRRTLNSFFDFML